VPEWGVRRALRDQNNGVDSIPDSLGYLLDTEFAKLATVAPARRPQLTEVWFLRDGDDVRISLNSSRQKTKNLAHNSSCDLFILDLADRYRYLELRGDAELEPDDHTFADRVGANMALTYVPMTNPGSGESYQTCAG
jgi:PPOX class probable F420-dependent enzyme